MLSTMTYRESCYGFNILYFRKVALVCLKKKHDIKFNDEIGKKTILFKINLSALKSLELKDIQLLVIKLHNELKNLEAKQFSMFPKSTDETKKKVIIDLNYQIKNLIEKNDDLKRTIGQYESQNLEKSQMIFIFQKEKVELISLLNSQGLINFKYYIMNNFLN